MESLPLEDWEESSPERSPLIRGLTSAMVARDGQRKRGGADRQGSDRRGGKL
jgi:hypothetical protein